MIHLATGIAIRDGRLLMVASSYPNHDRPLWALPGGRQLPGELLTETVEREFSEETGLHVQAGEVAYVSESYDRDTHYLNVTFEVTVPSSVTPNAGVTPNASVTLSGVEGQREDHVVAVEWVAIAELGERIAVAVVREPLIAYLRGDLRRRYAGYHDAGVTIEWPRDSR